MESGIQLATFWLLSFCLVWTPHSWLTQVNSETNWKDPDAQCIADNGFIWATNWSWNLRDTKESWLISNKSLKHAKYYWDTLKSEPVKLFLHCLTLITSYLGASSKANLHANPISTVILGAETRTYIFWITRCTRILLSISKVIEKAKEK